MNELTEFQLLRPLWLLGLLPVAWILWQAWRVKTRQGAWHQVIEPKFRHLLLGDQQSGEVTLGSKLAIFGLGLLWLIAIIALSGPSIKSVEMPAEKNQQGTVIVLDLSLSMLADDLAPNRLSRAKYKITDLLNRHPELSVGLVGYAGSAHAISPISEDNKTLLGMLPALNPVIMPSYGADPLQGFQRAKALFEGAHINHGHIIWITDDLEANQIPVLKTWIKQHDYSISILTVGTAEGGPVQIPNYGLLKDEAGKIILPNLPFERFNTLAQLDSVKVNNLNISDDSVEYLMPPMLATLSDEELAEQNKTRVITPLDEGAWLLWILVPLVALLYRRGWILSLGLLTPLSGFLAAGVLSAALLNPTESYAAQAQDSSLPSFLDAFKSPDQQGYQAWQQNNLQSAESLFEDEQWRASTQYRLGKYKEAAEGFAKDKSPTGFYNLANAQAKSGQLEEAKQSYQTALEKQPDFPAAQQNLQIIEQLLKQQEQQEQQKNSQQNNQKQDKNQQKQNDNPSERQQQNQSQNQDGSQKQQDQNPSSGKQKTNDLEDEEVPHPDEKADSQQQQNQADDQPSSDSQNSQQNADNKTQQASDQNEATQDIDQLTDQAEEKPDSQQNQKSPGKLSDQKVSDDMANQQADSDLNKQQQEQQQATQNWLKQIPDEPGLFLKRKFEYQFQQQPNQASENNGSQKQW